MSAKTFGWMRRRSEAERLPTSSPAASTTPTADTCAAYIAANACAARRRWWRVSAKAAAGSGYATATDLADWLVRTLKMPFREAHHVTGRIVGLASERGVGLEKLKLEEMQVVEPRITADVFGVLGVEKSVRSRTSYGGTAPANVRRQAKSWLKKLG